MPERLTRHGATAPRGKNAVCLAIVENLGARFAHELPQRVYRFLAKRD
jgi:hypothetical protein